jgi:hypothetical protein
VITARLLSEQFVLSLRAILLQTDGLTHADSLLQLPFHSNCMNWILGHVLLNREQVLDLLHVPRMFTDDAFARYERSSAPITRDEPGVIYTEELIEMLKEHAPRLSGALLSASDELYAGEVQVGEISHTVASRVLFHVFQEATHVGELGILRQLARKDDHAV